jgi:hypothetical protein
MANASNENTYQGYIRKWIRPRWEKYELSEVKAIHAESWLYSLAREKLMREDSQCNVHSVQSCMSI